jgi:hypothetical protein
MEARRQEGKEATTTREGRKVRRHGSDDGREGRMEVVGR